MDELNEEMEENEELELSENDLKARCLDKFEGKQITNPVKAIRAKCYDCCGFNYYEANRCTAYNCPLYPFRFGKNPYRAPRVISKEQKEAFAKRLADARAKRS